MTSTETNDALAAFNGNGDSTPAITRTKLADFEGLPVDESGIEIPGAGGGLHDALKVDPVELHKGDRVHIVLECEVGKIRFDPIDSGEADGPQRRVHVLKTTNATIVDRSVVADALVRQAERIAEAGEIAGQQKLEPPSTPTDPPFIGYDELTESEVIERVEACGTDDVDLVDAIELYEEANGGRAEVLAAIKNWRDG